jgi:hypothetical protein
MSLRTEQSEIEAVLFRLLDNLSLTISSRTGRAGADLRRQIGRVHDGYTDLIASGGFGIALLTCFRLAQDANVGLSGLAYVRKQLYKETPSGAITTSMVLSAITFCLSVESRIIVGMEFTSRDDVEKMMATMKVAFDTARDMAADAIDSSVYRTLTQLAGALTNHLATTARPLPRMVKFSLAKNFPALKLSQRLYYNADRAEELVAENSIVHPAFCLREIKGLNR